MSSNIPLTWATLTVSIMNTILLLWLGLTVLLNSERRSPGIWLAGIGLLMGSLFFLSHTAILGAGILQTESRMNLWWRTGWIPVASMPYAWYCVMLWYSSYWDDPQSQIHQRHQVPIILATLMVISTVGLIVLFNALPSYDQIIGLNLGGTLSIRGIPVLMIVYPLYLVMCIGFAMDVLLHPGEPGRLMGQIARQRARPWLVCATGALLLVSVAVGGIIIWGIQHANENIDPTRFALLISIFDLAIDLLIAVTILSTGQAIIAYEIFTGKAIPRQGLKRTWNLAVGLSLIIGGGVAWIMVEQLEPIYLVLFNILLIPCILAVFAWRSFGDQEKYNKSIRPLINSPHLYDPMERQTPDLIELDIFAPFQLLCEEILGVKQAFLIPLGIFGPLAGGEISYPKLPVPGKFDERIVDIQHKLTANTRFAPFMLAESDLWGKQSMAIPIWSERGLIGALVLGEKKNGSLYTQEEVEIARTVGERLIDSKASNELTHRLMDLQKQRLAESQVIDQRTRRALHDEILPRLQSTMIKLSSDGVNTGEAVKEMGELHHQLTAIMRQLPTTQEAEVAQRGLIGALQGTIENEYHPFFNSITWQIDGMANEITKTMPAYILDVLYNATREAVRNAARHGRESEFDRLINLLITISGDDRLLICVQDDGVGMMPKDGNQESQGHGLELHSTLMAVVGGSLTVDSVPEQYTWVRLKYPA